MPLKLTGLIRRKGCLTYAIRLRVPSDVVASFGKEEVTVSLRTRDHSEAERRYPDALKRLLEKFDEHRGSPTSRDAYARRVDELKYSRHARLQSMRASLPEQIAAVLLEPVPALKIPPDFAAALSLSNIAAERVLAEDRARLADLQRRYAVSDCAEFLAQTDAAQPYHERVKAALALMAVEIRALKDLTPPKAVAPPPPSFPPALTPPPVSRAPDFDEVLRTYLAQSHGQRWTAERKVSIETTVLDFAELTARLPIDKYNAAHGRTYKAALVALPVSWRKRKGLRELSIKLAADAAAASPQFKMQSAENLNKKLQIVGQFFDWARTEYADFNVANPVTGFRVAKKTGANEERDPFSIDQLNAMFRTPVFVGAKSDSLWKEPGLAPLRNSEKFWLPLLGLFTGARLNDLCQLTSAHVREHDGVVYLAFTKEMRLKKSPNVTLSPGIRSVPLHHELVAMGFLVFVATRGGLLFPGLPTHSSGRHSDAPSKWFARFITHSGIKTPKTNFHSLRHNFIAAAKRAGVQRDHIQRLVGQTIDGQTGRYGDSYVAEQEDMDLLLSRNLEMQKITWPGLEIDHLRTVTAQRTRFETTPCHDAVSFAGE